MALIKLKTPQSTICEEVNLSGLLKFSGKVIFKGKYTGRIESQGDLIIAHGAYVEGEIQSKNLIIEGKVKGNCLATEQFELTSTSSLIGNIRAKSITIADGVPFEGSCEMI